MPTIITKVQTHCIYRKIRGLVKVLNHNSQNPSRASARGRTRSLHVNAMWWWADDCCLCSRRQRVITLPPLATATPGGKATLIPTVKLSNLQTVKLSNLFFKNPSCISSASLPSCGRTH